MIKKENIKIVAPLFLLISTLLVGLIYQINRNKSQDIRSLAFTEEESARYCTNPPECCARMEQSRDAHECEWPIRGFCNNCRVIEGRQERCGWYWIWHDANDNEYKLGTNSPNGYGCMIGDSPSTMRPKYNKDGSINTLVPTAIPTVPPQPTFTPTPPTSIPTPTEIPLPTQIPTLPPLPPTQVVWPTQTRPQITYIPVVIPTVVPPSATPTTIPFKLNLPNILPPKEKVDSFFTSVKTNLLDFFSKILP